MSVYAELPDGRRLEFPDGTNPAVIQATVKKVLGVQQAPEITPEQQQQMAISATRGEHPILSKVADFGAGASGLARGILNVLTPNDLSYSEGVEKIRDMKIRGVLGDPKPKLSDLILGKRPEKDELAGGWGTQLLDSPMVDKDSGTYLAGSLADPIAWTTGGIATKVAPYIPVLGKGIVGGAKALTRNVVGGAVPGATIGALSEEGTAESGAAIGGALNAIIPPGIRALGQGAVRLWTAANPKAKARKILEDVLGDQLPAFRQAMARAPKGQTAAQAAYKLNNDLLNAADALARRLDETGYFTNLDATQRQDVVEDLVRLAGGRNLTEARQAVESARRSLGQVTEPAAQEALRLANTAGRVQPTINALEQRAAELGEAASGRVADVRRLEGAKQTAESIAQTGRMNQGGAAVPVLGQEGLAIAETPPFSRGIELVNVAERGSSRAADESLALGAASRNAAARAQQIRDDLAQRGLAPLDTGRIIAGLRGMLRDPSIGPVDLNEKVLSNVAQKIKEWTNDGGVIDAEALRVIRTNAVNDAVEQQLGNKLDPKALQQRAASLLKRVKPLIDKAIEKAGGTGWRAYLFDYESGARLIDRQRMGGKALELFEKSPKKLESLAAGNEPKIVKDIFKTEYDLGLAMGKDIGPIESVAAHVERGRTMAAGAARGEAALQNVLGRHKASWILPNWINASIAVTNRGLKEAELRINEKTLFYLTRALKSGADANALLQLTPINERSKLIKAMINSTESPKTRAFLTGMLNGMQE